MARQVRPCAASRGSPWDAPFRAAPLGQATARDQMLRRSSQLVPWQHLRHLPIHSLCPGKAFVRKEELAEVWAPDFPREYRPRRVRHAVDYRMEMGSAHLRFLAGLSAWFRQRQAFQIGHRGHGRPCLHTIATETWSLPTPPATKEVPTTVGDGGKWACGARCHPKPAQRAGPIPRATARRTACRTAPGKKFRVCLFLPCLWVSGSVQESTMTRSIISRRAFLALKSCDLDVPSSMPSMSAISRWEYPSMTYRLNTAR